MNTRLVLLLFSFATFFTVGGGTCRTIPGSRNYCGYSYCYLYTSANGQVGEMLTKCTNTSYFSSSYLYIYIYSTDNLDIQINLGNNIQSVTFNLYRNIFVNINTTKVHTSLTRLYFNYRSYHFNQANFFSYFPHLVYFYARAFIDFTHPQSFTALSQLTYFKVYPPSGYSTWKFEFVSNAFSGLRRLKYIDIVRADITDIRYTFQGLTALTHLGLEGNKISQLDPDEFKDLISLSFLDLDGNGISIASPDAFNGLSKLIHLSLSGNPLFPLGSIYRLTKLVRLQLNYNSYRTLSPDPFEQLNNLRYIYADNPYFCDCNLRWTSVVAQYGIQFISATCLEPSKAYNSLITNEKLYTNCTIDRSYNCFNKSNTCPTDFVCKDLVTRTACTCTDGFVLLSSGKCVDEDECDPANTYCEQYCNNTVGSYECYCDIGYQLSADDRSCEDVDECELGLGPCLIDETCINTIGSYACKETGCVISCENPQNNICTCCDGYNLFNRSHCVDIDECHESLDTCEMNCQNTKGGYQCSCEEGFQLVNQTECLDIDECLNNNGGCNDICLNSKGSFYCLNIDIKSLESYECDEFGYPSSCSSDYQLDPQCGCCHGYRVLSNSECGDIDECKESTDQCEMICTNTQGSYRCSCQTGYQLVNDSLCLDIDECLTGNGGCLHTCFNTVGSYTCLNVNITAMQNTIDGSTFEINNFLLTMVVLLVVFIIILVGVFLIIIVVMRYVKRQAKSYNAVLRSKTTEREDTFEIPSRAIDESATLLEMVNTTDDVTSETSVELYPAPLY